MNHWAVFGPHLLLKIYFVPGLDQDLRLLFVQIKGKTKKNVAQAPRRGVTTIEEVMLQWAATAEGLLL